MLGLAVLKVEVSERKRSGRANSSSPANVDTLNLNCSAVQARSGVCSGARREDDAEEGTRTVGDSSSKIRIREDFYFLFQM